MVLVTTSYGGEGCSSVGIDVGGCFRGNNKKTPEGLQKQRRHHIEYTRKSRVTANVNKCAVHSCIVCNQDKVNPGTFTGKRGENELPIADQYTCLGVEVSK